MTDLGPILGRLGLAQYLDVLVSEGFETWDTLLDIQETDFDALSFKLGHRRKLQRAIAEYRGVPYERLYGPQALESPSDSSRQTDAGPPGLTTGAGVGGSTYETKRKYRRHPKADDNAPERPPSAYVIFSNKIREEVKEQNLSFTQIAKLVGDRWQKLDAQGKEPYEAQANAAKERYNIQLSAYKKTEAFHAYSQYLADFRAKHGGGPTAGGPSEQKKPKLEGQESGMLSIGSASESAPLSRGHSRGGSIGSINSTTVSTTPTSPTRNQVPITMRPQLQSSTSLPSRHPPPVMRGGTPPSGFGREPRWRQTSGPVPGPPHLSTQSSISDTSSAMRSDSDPLVRTASLSLSTPPTRTPPLPSHGDKPSSTDAGRPRFPGPPPSLPSYGSTTSGHSQALPSPLGSESSWRGRPNEVRSYIEAGGAMQPPPPHLPPPPIAPVTLPILPPILGAERGSDFQHRTLPLPRTSPTIPSGLVQATSRFPDSAHSSFPFTGPPYPIRRESTSEAPMERSESDAASALASLASRPESTHKPGSILPQDRRWDHR